MEIGQSTERVKTTPKDFFLNFGWLIALYGGVISLLNMLFGTIDHAFPDKLNPIYGNAGGVRTAMAWLIILFPTYIIISRYLRKIFSADPSRRETWVRRWFVYLTLFLSSVAVIIDVIVLLNGFLNGDLTTRFVMKVLATLIVSGVVFGYYFYDLRKEGGSAKTGSYFMWGSILLVIGGIVWGFAVVGSPVAQRAVRFDEQRISDLQDIQYRIGDYWSTTDGKLPQSLADLSNEIGSYKAPTDPETNEAYEYTVTGAKNFSLCATFNAPSQDNNYTYPASAADFWRHGAGRTCFDRSVNEATMPPTKGSVVTPRAAPVIQ